MIALAAMLFVGSLSTTLENFNLIHVMQLQEKRRMYVCRFPPKASSNLPPFLSDLKGSEDCQSTTLRTSFIFLVTNFTKNPVIQSMASF